MTFQHSGEVWRKTASGSKYIFALQGDIACFLQPLDIQSAQDFGITFTKASQLYVGRDTDILEGDRIIINGDKYGVRGFKTYDFGNLAHKKAILEKL